MPVVTMPDGVQVRFPDDMPPDQIRGMILQKFPDAAQSAAASPPAVEQPAPVPVPMPQPRPAVQTEPMSPWVQGLGAGVAELQDMASLTNPFRAIPAAANIGARLGTTINQALNPPSPTLSGMVTGESPAPAAPPQFPALPSASESLGNQATAIGESLGYRTTPSEEMPFADRAKYNIARIGSQAVAGIPVMAKAAATRAVDLGRGALPGLGDRFLSAYMGDKIGRTAVGDVGAGIGAGSTLTAAQEIPEDIRSQGGGSVGTVADMLSMLFGGVGGVTAVNSVVGGAKSVAKAAGRPFTGNVDSAVPLDPSMPIPQALENRPTTTATDRAAGTLQSRVSDPGGVPAVLERFRANQAELQPHMAEMPTPAALAEDQGLFSLQRTADMDNAPRAATRDQQFRTGVRDTIDRVAPEGATAQPLIDRAQSVADTRIDVAQRGVDRATGRQRGVDMARTEEANALPANPAEAKVDASRRLDQAVVNEGYIPARREKNRQFDEAPGRNEDLPADDLIDTAADLRARNNALRPDEQLPTNVVQRLEALAPRMEEVDGQMVNVGGPGTARGGDLAELRMPLADAEKRARQSGNFDMADSIGRLRASINRTIEEAPGYSEANANYRQFADTYRPSPGDPMARFTREVDREPFVERGVPARGATPPEKTASRFLDSGQPQDTGALNRATNASPARGEANRATRDYLMADMASKGVVDQRTGTINLGKFRKWVGGRADLDDVPGFRAEVDGMMARAQRGERLSGQFADEITAAQQNLKQTRDQIDKGALGLVINSDPDKAVAAVMGTPNRSGRMLDELIRVTEADPQARNGLKAAVRDFLVDKATTTATETLAPGDRRGPVSYAKLTKIFNEHEQELARVFTPEEMNTLRAGHRALELSNASRVRVTSGSDTTEKLFDRLRNTNLGKGVEAAFRLKYGVLQTGGLAATARRLLPVQTATDVQVRELLTRAAFEPKVMELLLGRKVPVGSPTWNKRYNRLIAATEGAREVTDEDED